MGRFIYLVVALFCVVSGRLVYSESRNPDTTESYRTDELLSRWRVVRRLVIDDALGRDQHREGAMVLVLGPTLEHSTESKDEAVSKSARAMLMV